MNKNIPTGRALKKRVFEILQSETEAKINFQLSQIQARRVINPLISFLCSNDEKIKWRAVAAIGSVVSALADKNRESARVIMRRLMWHLNDESGGIGWGVPEAMGEIMARHRGLAEEYCCILISYMQPDGNYIEHELLQRGVLWGFGRMAGGHPDLATPGGRLLLAYMGSADPVLRGLSAWCAGAVRLLAAKPILETLVADKAMLTLFQDHRLKRYTVGQLAQKALLETE